MKTLRAFSLTLIFVLAFIITTFSQQQQPIDPAMLYVQEFQQVMTSIFPTQRFSFDLVTGQERTIQIWPQADTQTVDIAFYINNDRDPTLVTGEGFFVSCSINQVRTHSFDHQKLGACRINIASRPSFINMHFRTQRTPVIVYLQYQIKKMQIQTIPNESTTQNVPTQPQDKRKKLSQISQKFEKVKKRTQLQEGALRLLTKSFNKHNTRFQKNIKYAYHRLMIETGLVVVSGVLGFWMIKRQMGNGYEMLV